MSNTEFNESAASAPSGTDELNSAAGTRMSSSKRKRKAPPGNPLVRLAIYTTACCLLTVAGGYAQGMLNGRWGVHQDLERIGNDLENTPRHMEGYELAKVDQLDDRAVEILESQGEIVRTYICNETRERITVSVIVGPAGPISLHDPDVCYPNNGYRVLEEPRRKDFLLGDKPLSLWSTTLGSPEMGGEVIQVCWGWNDGQEWGAPDNARFHYAGAPYLYKIQVVTVRRPGTPAKQADKGTEDFLRHFLPILPTQTAANVDNVAAKP